MNENKLIETLYLDENERKENLFRWSLRELVARKTSGVIWGEGYVFQSDKQEIEKRFKKFSRMNKLPMLLGFVERQCSKYGRCIITINKTETGEFMLNIPNPFYFNGVGKVFVQEQLAVIWQRFTIDNNFFIVKSTYDTKKCENIVYGYGDNKIRVLANEAEILKALRIEKIWYHNLGFVPVVEIINLPLFQFEWNQIEFVKITDWFPAFEFEGLIYDTIRNLKKELFYCHTRIGIDNANQDFINRIKSALAVGNDIDIGDWIIESETGAEVKILPGNGDFSKYTKTIDDLLDFYIKFCGQSRFSEGGGAQKSIAETFTNRSSLVETIQSKIKLREEQYTELFRKILCAYGFGEYWDDDNFFTFKINGNISRDESVYIDNLEKQISIGMMTTIEAIQEKFGLTQTEAEKKFKEVQAFNEEYGISLQSEDSENGKEKTIDEEGNHRGDE